MRLSWQRPAAAAGVGEEMAEKQQLEEQLRAYQDKKRYKKRQIRELQEDLQVSRPIRARHIIVY